MPWILATWPWHDMAMDTSNAIFTKSSQLLGFADDLDVIGRTMDVIKEKVIALEEGGSNFGFKINDEKTEYMVVSSSDRQYGPTVTINQHNFEVVDNFLYLGSQVNSKNDIVDEIRRRLTLGNRWSAELTEVQSYSQKP